MSITVEREAALEQRLGIAISGLYASRDDEQYMVNGEFRTLPGKTLDEDLQIIANFYDARGRIIITENHLVRAQKFDRLDSFSIGGFYDAEQPEVIRILVFPKKW